MHENVLNILVIREMQIKIMRYAIRMAKKNNQRRKLTRLKIGEDVEQLELWKTL